MRTVLLLLSLLVASAPLLAQCQAGRVPRAGGGYGIALTSPSSVPAPACMSNPVAAEAWFVFDSCFTSWTVARTGANCGQYAYVAVYEGTDCNNLREIGCAGPRVQFTCRNIPYTFTEVSFWGQGGGTYWVRVMVDSGGLRVPPRDISFSGAIATRPTARVRGGNQICAGLQSSRIYADITSEYGGSTGRYDWDITWSDGFTESISHSSGYVTHFRDVSPSTTTVYTITSIVDRCGNPGSSSGSARVDVIAPPDPITSVSISGGLVHVTGSGFYRSPFFTTVTIIYVNQTPLPTTLVSDTLITAPLPPLGPAGGAPVYIITLPLVANCWIYESNALPLVWNPAHRNRGTIINLTSGGQGGPSSLKFRVEGGEPNQSTTIMADFGSPFGTFFPPISLPILGDQVISAYSPGAVPITTATLDSAGEFELTLPAPAEVSGMPFRLQAMFVDPSRSGVGLSFTWPLEAFVP